MQTVLLSTLRMHASTALVVLGSSLLATTAAAQLPPSSPAGLPQGVTREQMWPAPTAEDWKKPCLIPWQRTYADALAVARETKKAMLICVNMDGEIASEHYAGIRYRDPAIAKLYEAYVPVIASVYRHNARDYDDEGHRILCPRFGNVTCGEHIAIEPGLFDQFFDGKRIAPRHIGVEVEQNSAEMYDVYYAWDTDTIFNSLRDGIAKRTTVPITVVRSDRPVVERIGSVDVEDRTAVEDAYIKGDHATRQMLLERAIALGAGAPADMLRLAVFGLDDDLKRLARRALSQSTSESDIDLILEALRAQMPPEERDALIAALGRIGESSTRARTLSTVYQGLKGTTSAVDVDAWSKALVGSASYEPASDRSALVSRLETRARASEAKPEDAGARLDFAESVLAVAVDRKTERRFSRVMLEDAQRSALEAERLGLKGWRVNSAIAIAAYYLGQIEEGYTRAEAAVGAMPNDAQSWSASAVLALFAESRQRAISKASREKTAWPPQWLTDVNAAYSVLAKHPFGTDAQVAAHFDFLKSLQALGEAGHVLDDGLARFKDSWILHDRMRTRILSERGVDGLEVVYEAMLKEPGALPSLESFAGYASLVAAEFKRRTSKDDQAIAAYERGIAHYESWVAADATSRATADHFIALALAGRARIAYEHGENELALQKLLASFARKPEAAASLDGLNISPVDTAKMLRVRFIEAKRDDLLAQLQGALDKLDPELLKLPAYEREVPSTNGAGGGQRRRGPPPGK